MLFLAAATAAFAPATTAPAYAVAVVNIGIIWPLTAGSSNPEKIRVALTKTDLKPNQLIMGCKGVKFDKTGQNILAATCLIQLYG